MKRVRISIGELHLASMTMAGKKRLAYVEQGLVALDEEQALLKGGIEELLEAYQKTVSKDDRLLLKAVDDLLAGLQKLVKEELPRVNYPDRRLLDEEPRREIPLRGPAPPKSTVRQLKDVQKNLGKIPKTEAKVK